MDRFPKPKVETPIFEVTSQDRLRSCIMSMLQSVPRQQTHQRFGFDTTMLPNVTGKSMYNVETDGPMAKSRVNGEHFETDPIVSSFGFDTTMLPNVTGKSMYNVETDGPMAKSRVNGEHFETDPIVSSILYGMRDTKKGTNCVGEKKIKVNEDEGSQKQLPNAKHFLPMSENQAKSENQAVTRRSMFTSEGQSSMNVVRDTLMGSANDNIVGANISLAGSTSMDGTDNAATASSVHRKESSKTVCSKRYKEVMDALLKPVSSYTLLFEPHLVPTSKKTPRKKVGKSKVATADEEIPTPLERDSAGVESADEIKAKEIPTPLKRVSVDEIKSNENLTPRKKVSWKSTPNGDEIKLKETPTKKWESFPSNVKTLTATGMLDGVGVKYLSASREKELSGIIKGTSYLCGCKSCNYSNALSADQFEDHAGCKTSHPNNHIHLENDLSQLGNVKSLHKIVQELKHTPTSMLCDAIQALMGASLNQQVFSSWKKSFEAASSKR